LVSENQWITSNEFSAASFQPRRKTRPALTEAQRIAIEQQRAVEYKESQEKFKSMIAQRADRQEKKYEIENDGNIDLMPRKTRSKKDLRKLKNMKRYESQQINAKYDKLEKGERDFDTFMKKKTTPTLQPFWRIDRKILESILKSSEPKNQFEEFNGAREEMGGVYYDKYFAEIIFSSGSARAEALRYVMKKDSDLERIFKNIVSNIRSF